MKGYPVDPILSTIRSYVCKTQGRWTVAVPEAGTGDRSQFGCVLHCEGQPVGSVYAKDMVMHFAGEWPGPLERNLPGYARERGFKVTTQFVGGEVALAEMIVKTIETGRMELPKCPQCRGMIEIHTNGVQACPDCGYRFTPRAVAPAPPSALPRPSGFSRHRTRDLARRVFNAVARVIRSEGESG